MLIGRETPHGGDIYHHETELDFSANVNPLGTPPEVVRAVRAAAENLCAYPDPYCTKLTEAIARAERVDRGQVICGNGAADLIFSWCLALHPRRALLPVPAFSEYEQALRAVGCVPEYFAMRREDGFALGEDILEHITEETDVLFLCNPNNPTGALIPRGLLEAAAARCRETGTRLLLDECFNDFLDDPERRTMKPYLDEFPQIFLLKAFTKLYGMAGVRLGYGLCADRALLEKMGQVTQAWNVSTVAQAAGEAALSVRDLAGRTRELVRAEREYLGRELSSLGIRVWPGAANYLMITCGAPLAGLLMEKKILIRSCANYRGLSEHDFRIAVRMHGENERLIRAVREVLGREGR